LKSCCVIQDHYDDEHDKIVLHETIPDVQDQDRNFWCQTGLVLRPTVSDHITATESGHWRRIPLTFSPQAHLGVFLVLNSNGRLTTGRIAKPLVSLLTLVDLDQTPDLAAVCFVVERIDPIRFWAGCHKRWLNQAVSVLSIILHVFRVCSVMFTTAVLLVLHSYVLSLGCSDLVVSTSASDRL